MGEIKNNIQLNIRKYLKLRDISQKEFAEKMNVSQSAVTNWVSGRNLPDIESVAQICDVLEVSITELLGYPKQTKQNTEQMIHAFEKLSDPFQEHILKEIENLIVLQEKVSK